MDAFIESNSFTQSAVLKKLSRYLLLLLVIYTLVCASEELENLNDDYYLNKDHEEELPDNYSTSPKNPVEEFEYIFKNQNDTEEIKLVGTVDGYITAYNVNDGSEKWKVYLDTPLININVNQQNGNLYSGPNMIPGQDGNLYVYNGIGKIEILDIPLKALIEKSPFTLKSLPDNIFVGDKSTRVYILDIEKGEIRKDSEGGPGTGTGNKKGTDSKPNNLITLIRIDYTLKNLVKDRGVEFWKMSVSEITAIENKSEGGLEDKSSSPSDSFSLSKIKERKDKNLVEMDVEVEHDHDSSSGNHLFDKNPLTPYNFFKRLLPDGFQQQRTTLPVKLSNYRSQDMTNTFKNYLEKIKNNEIKNEDVKIFEEILKWSKEQLMAERDKDNNFEKIYLFAVVSSTVLVILLSVIVFLQIKNAELEKRLMRKNECVDREDSSGNGSKATTAEGNDNNEGEVSYNKQQTCILRDSNSLNRQSSVLELKEVSPFMQASNCGNDIENYNTEQRKFNRSRLQSVDHINSRKLELSDGMEALDGFLEQLHESHGVGGSSSTKNLIEIDNNARKTTIPSVFATRSRVKSMSKQPVSKSKMNNTLDSFDAEFDESKEEVLIPTQVKKLDLPGKQFSFPVNNRDIFEHGRLVKSFNHFEKIGEGGFSQVFVARHNIDRSIYAIKVIHFKCFDNEDILTHPVVKEVLTMRKLSSPNVVRYLTCWFEKDDCLKINRNTEDGGISMTNAFKSEAYPNLKVSSAVDKMKADSGFEEDDAKFNVTNSFVHFDHENMKEEGAGEEVVKEEESISVCESETMKSISKPKLKKHFLDESDLSDPSVNAIQSKSIKSKPKNSSGNNDTYSNIKFIQSKSKAIVSQIEEEDDDSHDSKKHRDKKQAKNQPSKMSIFFYVQMEYCSGMSLKDFLQQRTVMLDQKTIFQFFSQIVKAVDYIHENKIIHRDLKPANIFIEGKKLIVGDFGLAASKHDGHVRSIERVESDVNTSITASEKDKTVKLKDNVGTPLYQSPEQLEDKFYNEKVDIYALGLILLEMCSLFGTQSEKIHVFNSLRKEHKLPDEVNKDFTQEAKLILLMTEKEPKDRPSAKEILKSSEAYKALKKLYKD